MQTKNLKSFYVWYIITCHLTAYQALRNRFSAMRLHDYLHYCGLFLAHFLMKLDRNIISSLQYSLLTLSASWLCDVCTDFINVIKVDDVNNSDYGGPQLSRQNKKSRHYKLYSRQNKINSRQNKINSRQNKENELVSGWSAVVICI